jgi:large subunit ribosomal protein L10
MNRDQKAVAIAEIATHIDESEAIFAVDYRGITVAQVAELRAKLRESDAIFKVVKNSLTERAADEVGAQSLKGYLTGPTALTFVRGDVATAAKTVADYGRTTQLLPFKGGLMGADTLDVEQIRSLSCLPSREVLYGQLVGVVASPISGLVRTLNALLSGVAVALGQVQAKKESGEIPAGEAQPAAEEAPVPEAESEPAAKAEPAAEAESVAEPEAEAPAAADEPAAEAQAETQTEPEADAPAQADDNNADVSAEDQPQDAETNPTKED